MNLGICDCNATVVDDSNKCPIGACGFLYDQLLQHPVQPVSNPAFDAFSFHATNESQSATPSAIWILGLSLGMLLYSFSRR